LRERCSLFSDADTPGNANGGRHRCRPPLPSAFCSRSPRLLTDLPPPRCLRGTKPLATPCLACVRPVERRCRDRLFSFLRHFGPVLLQGREALLPSRRPGGRLRALVLPFVPRTPLPMDCAAGAPSDGFPRGGRVWSPESHLSCTLSCRSGQARVTSGALQVAFRPPNQCFGLCWPVFGKAPARPSKPASRQTFRTGARWRSFLLDHGFGP